MCGRFARTSDTEKARQQFLIDKLPDEPPPPSGNVSPTNKVLVVRERSGRRVGEVEQWGFVPPSWSKRRGPWINADHENVLTASVYHDKDREAPVPVIVPADGFDEWQWPEGKARGKPNIRWRFHLEGDQMLALAGMIIDKPEGPRLVVVTQDNTAVPPWVHQRQPLILPEDRWEPYLEGDPDQLPALLTPTTPTLVMDRVGGS